MTLADDGALGTLPELRVGLADDFAQGTSHPLPNARLESPGRLAASAGTGEDGGPVRTTVRHDRSALQQVEFSKRQSHAGRAGPSDLS